MPYGIFYPGRLSEPYFEMDWHPFFGFTSPNSRPERRARPMRHDVSFDDGFVPVQERDFVPVQERDFVPVQERDFVPIHRRRPVAKPGRTLHRQRKLAHQDKGLQQKEIFIQHSGNNDEREMFGEHGSELADGEYHEVKPQNNLMSKERLDRHRHMRGTAGSSKSTSKIGPSCHEVTQENDVVKKSDKVIKAENKDKQMPKCNAEHEDQDKKANIKIDDSESHNKLSTDCGNESTKEMGLNNSRVKVEKMQSIENISKEVERLVEKINELKCTEKNKDYLYIEEMLTKCLLRLDDILTEGDEEVRKLRKSVVERINKELQNLEDKITVDKNFAEDSSSDNNNDAVDKIIEDEAKAGER